MDIELKEKEEEKRKEEERRARIAKKNCNVKNFINNIISNRYKRNRRSKKESIYFFWEINFS